LFASNVAVYLPVAAFQAGIIGIMASGINWNMQKWMNLSAPGGIRGA
jgi:hypothetical protein